MITKIIFTLFGLVITLGVPIGVAALGTFGSWGVAYPEWVDSLRSLLLLIFLIAPFSHHIYVCIKLFRNSKRVGFANWFRMLLVTASAVALAAGWVCLIENFALPQTHHTVL
jgi:hypothetical protein